MRGLYESLSPEIVVLGGTQVMKSEWLLIDHLATAYCGYSVFFVLRNHDAKDTYVQNRINKVLEAVPFYRQVMKDSTFDRLDIKKFGKGQIKYVGSGIEADFREYPACLDKDTSITLECGKRTTIADINIGDVVRCIDADLNQTHDVVTGKLNTGIKPVFLITTKSGKKVRATLNHEFFTSIGWKKLHELVIDGASTKLSNGIIEPVWEVCCPSVTWHDTWRFLHKFSKQQQKLVCLYDTRRETKRLLGIQEEFNGGFVYRQDSKTPHNGSDNKGKTATAHEFLPLCIEKNTPVVGIGELSMDEVNQAEIQAYHNNRDIEFHWFCRAGFFDPRRWFQKTKRVEDINSFIFNGISGMSNKLVINAWHKGLDIARRSFKCLWGYAQYSYRQGWCIFDFEENEGTLFSRSSLQAGLHLCPPTSFGNSEGISKDIHETRSCFSVEKNVRQSMVCKKDSKEAQPYFGRGHEFGYEINSARGSENEGWGGKDIKIEGGFDFYSEEEGFDPVVSVVFDGFSECYDIETKKHHNFFANGVVSHNSSIFVDELNDCNWSNVRFGFSRMDGNIYKFKRFVSNSKTKEHPAEQLLQESTNQDWQVPCVGCGKRHRLDWFETVVNPIEDSEGNVVDYTLKDREWRPGCGRDIVCVCPECGGALDRLSTGGLWVPKNLEAKMEGFHIPSLCSSIASVSELWREFQMGINNPHEMQLFFTRRLAVPFSAVGSKVTGSVMDKCKGTYNMILRPDRAFIAGDSCEGPCTMGVDVGSEKLDVRISKMLTGNKRQAVFIGKIDTKNIEELNDLIERYHVEKVVIDIQPEQALVTQFQETCEADVWLVKLGRKDQTKLENMNYQRKIISYDRTEILDRTYAQLQSGKNIIPENYADIFGGNYVSEMSSPIREMHLDKDGNPIFIWESDGKDHQRFADAYDYLAMRLLNEDGSYITSDCIYDFTKSV
jgi:hypothetical protein